MLNRLKSKNGFTLIELIIVVVILGILILIVLAATRGDKNKASDASLRADLARTAQAMEDCYVTGTGYQTTGSTCVTGKFDSGAAPATVTVTPNTDASPTYTATVNLSDGAAVTATQKQ